MFSEKLPGKRILMVIAPEDFRDEELFKPVEIFESAEAEVKIASRSLGLAHGMLGGTAKPDLLISNAKSADFDAIVVVGGSGSPGYLWPDENLHRLLQQADAEKKVIGAICLAGVVLARAGLLEGRQATVYQTKESLEEYKKARVVFSDQHVVIDDHFVTADGPRSAAEFGEAIAGKLT